MLGLGLSLATTGVVSSPAAAIVAAFKTRVETDGGTVESPSCAKSAVKFLLDNSIVKLETLWINASGTWNSTALNWI